MFLQPFIPCLPRYSHLVCRGPLVFRASYFTGARKGSHVWSTVSWPFLPRHFSEASLACVTCVHYLCSSYWCATSCCRCSVSAVIIAFPLSDPFLCTIWNAACLTRITIYSRLLHTPLFSLYVAFSYFVNIAGADTTNIAADNTVSFSFHQSQPFLRLGLTHTTRICSPYKTFITATLITVFVALSYFLSFIHLKSVVFVKGPWVIVTQLLMTSLR